MAFDWLKDFYREREKPENYADKTLAAYRLEVKAGGSIRGVSIQVAPDCCEAARRLPEGQIYQPDEAPRLPLPDCPLGRRCRCLYRPMMTYQPGKP
jgi:hypothetical protein